MASCASAPASAASAAPADPSAAAPDDSTLFSVVADFESVPPTVVEPERLLPLALPSVPPFSWPDAPSSDESAPTSATAMFPLVESAA